MAKQFISIDLGTSNTLVYVDRHGVVFNEPSVVAFDTETREIIAVGELADKMIGKTHADITIVKPLKDGVISDIHAAEALLRYVFNKLKIAKVFKGSTVLLSCPSEITQVDREVLKTLALKMGATRVYVEEEIKMAALGAGIDIYGASGHMVIDIGGGTTDIGIISLGDVVLSKSIRIAGNYFDNEIVRHLRENYNLMIGEQMAERVKMGIGTLLGNFENKKMDVFGRDVVSALPRKVQVSTKEIKDVLSMPFEKITEVVIETLEQTPPELAADLVMNGITLCGGGARIEGLVEYLQTRLEIPVKVSQDPLMSVLEGQRLYQPNIA